MQSPTDVYCRESGWYHQALSAYTQINVALNLLPAQLFLRQQHLIAARKLLSA